MGRPRKQDITVATTDRILEAAQAHFSKLGFDAARLQDIAGAAGITRPSLLYHFESKEVLYNAVVERTFSDLLQAFSEIRISGSGARDFLDGVVATYVRFLGENPSVSGIVLRELIGPPGRGQEILLEQLVPVIDWVDTALEKTGGELAVEGLPIRAALMLVASDAMLQAGSGSIREELWGPVSKSRELAQMLFFGYRNPDWQEDQA